MDIQDIIDEVENAVSKVETLDDLKYLKEEFLDLVSARRKWLEDES